VLYIGRGDEVRVGGGRAAAGGGFSIPAILKPKRRGRGDARAPLDEGNRGGIGGASLPLPPSTGRHPMAVHGAAAPAGAVAARALSEEGDDLGWAESVERSRPVAKISKEMTWAIKVNQAKLTMGCGIFFSQFSNKDLGFKIKDFKFQTKIELRPN
jgi:hypothetical protein